MKKYDKDLEKLSAYIDDELSPEEKNELETKIALSQKLQAKLRELKRVKSLTISSVKNIPESMYFETRLKARLNEQNTLTHRMRKWVPALSFTMLAVVLMLFLRYNPGAIENIVEQQKTNIAGFYKENLKPLLFAANLTNEDIFNFAFSKQLPLDNSNKQYLLLGSDSAGGYFEIKTAGLNNGQNDLQKFYNVLKLNNTQKKEVDSILESYADAIQSQVLVNDRNTLAINSNLWNYNKALRAELMAFAAHANRREFRKVVPSGYIPYNQSDIRKIVAEVKRTNDPNYIFFTRDTIFSGKYEFDKAKFREEMERMKRELKENLANLNINRNFAVKLHLDSSFIRLKNDTSWGNQFTVRIDTNVCRVQIPGVNIPKITLPNFDSIAANIDIAANMFKTFSFNISSDKNSGHINFKMNFGDSTNNFNMNFPFPNIDSLIKNHRVMNDSLLYNFRGRSMPFSPDSLAMLLQKFIGGDSTHALNRNQDIRKQMREFQKEIENFKREMDKLKKQLKQKENKNKEPQSIEI